MLDWPKVHEAFRQLDRNLAGPPPGSGVAGHEEKSGFLRREAQAYLSELGARLQELEELGATAEARAAVALQYQ